MEQMNLRGRTTLIAVVTGLAVLAWAWQAQKRGPTDAIRLGQDLKGGTTIRFSIEQSLKAKGIEPERQEKVLEDTIRVIRDRIDTYGLSETVITSVGVDRFEISLPAGAQGEAKAIGEAVTQLGDLAFKIEVRPREQYDPEEGKFPPRLASGDPNDWPWPGSAEEFEAFKNAEVEAWLKAHDSATLYRPSNPRYLLARRAKTESREPSAFHLLENTDDCQLFTGKMLSDPVVGADPRGGQPVVLFDIKLDYQKSFKEWTGRNLYLPMAILLNEEYTTAPRINDELSTNVQVTLGERSFDAAKKEAEELAKVLQTGSLEVRPIQESQHEVGARLAGESRDRGIYATILAFALVLAFMVLYYRGGGMVANLALLLNLVLLIGVLAFFQAVLTLPGIAGVVLTIGMAVDANILICERMHEERRLGRTLRKAVSEGYDRALSAIVDANLTSVITAIFLYQFGSGPIRGFAITLAVGLVVSMFTAIFVTRTIYEWRLKSGRLTEITMWGSGIPTKIRWMALRRVFAPISALGILLGLGAYFATDRATLYDIDFTGGYKVQARFTQQTTVDEVRAALEGPTIPVKVLTRVERAEGDLQEVEKEIPAGPYPGAEILAVGGGRTVVEINVQRGVEEGEHTIDELGSAFQAYLRTRLADRLQPDWIADRPARVTATESSDPLHEFDGGLTLRLNLHDPDGVVKPEHLEQVVRADFPYWTETGGARRASDPLEVGLVRTVRVAAVGEATGAVRSFDLWLRSKDAQGEFVEVDPRSLETNLGAYLASDAFRDALAEAGALAPEAVAAVATSRPFSSVDLIGSRVAKQLKDDAIFALALSLLAIIVYIAVRFKSRAMGLSAVLCLFHDVAFTLGIVAMANATGLVDAKINLTMVAAFLTLVGYSVNDTVVIFDRIRENRGKRPLVDSDLIDLSINQTLARSIKTSVTVFLVCLALFALNVGQRNVLEGFAFVLLVGTVIGSYSTIAIASPLLLFLPWYWQRVRRWRPTGALVGVPASRAALLPLVPVAALLWLAWAVAFVVGVFAVGVLAFPVWAVTREAKAAAVE